jgi:hypothetical protein
MSDEQIYHQMNRSFEAAVRPILRSELAETIEEKPAVKVSPELVPYIYNYTGSNGSYTASHITAMGQNQRAYSSGSFNFEKCNDGVDSEAVEANTIRWDEEFLQQPFHEVTNLLAMHHVWCPTTKRWLMTEESR